MPDKRLERAGGGTKDWGWTTGSQVQRGRSECFCRMLKVLDDRRGMVRGGRYQDGSCPEVDGHGLDCAVGVPGQGQGAGLLLLVILLLLHMVMMIVGVLRHLVGGGHHVVVVIAVVVGHSVHQIVLLLVVVHQGVVFPLVDRSPSGIHKKVRHGRGVESKLSSYCHLHLL